MTVTDGLWQMSAPHPDTGEIVVTNHQGRVVARVANEDDAILICRARNECAMPVPADLDWQTFGRNVANARVARKWTQSDAARVCNISRNYISMIERGIVTSVAYEIIWTLTTWLEIDPPHAS